MRLYITIYSMLFIPFIIYGKDLKSEYENILNDINSNILKAWKLTIRPNILFVNKEKNTLLLLTCQNNTFKVKKENWDNKIMLANSVVNYKGSKYITINYNTYKKLSYIDKKKIIAHESFHYYQDSLHYKMVSSNNTHLDNGEGRVLFRCELNALYFALKGDTSALKDALHLRNYRQKLYPGNNEAEFELNEGLAEYTSFIYTYKSLTDIQTALFKKIINNSEIGYTNYFAYITGPIYGYFQMEISSTWNNKPLQDITDNLKLIYHIPPMLPISTINLIKEKYNYTQISNEESFTNSLNKKFNTLLKHNLYIRIKNNHINILFNPNDRIIEINDSIVLLKDTQLKAEWGIVYVQQGLMKRKDWSYFFLPPPKHSNKEETIGNNYRLILNPNYNLIKTEEGWEIIKLKN